MSVRKRLRIIWMLLNHRRVASLLIPSLLLAGLTVSAADDAYLKMLEEEAETVELDDSGQLKQGNSDKSATKNPAITMFEWDGTTVKEGFPKELDQEAFEAFLHKYYYGTYTFFRKLDSTDKNTVYYRYMKDGKPSIENIRQNVMTLLKQ